MVSGTVSFTAKITGNGLAFPRVEYDPGVPNLPRVEVEAPDGFTINVIGHVDTVADANAATELVRGEVTKALDRIAFAQGAVIQAANPTGHQLQQVDDPNGLHLIGADMVMFVQGIEVTKAVQPEPIKALLESAPLPGEHNYSFLRHAMQSRSLVEEFTNLYTILLNFYNDSQLDVDAFIVSEDAGVPQSQQPPKPGQKKPPRNETIYTRLRNELAHRRQGVDMANTKAEAVNRIGGLRALVKRAIELHP